MFFFLNVKKIKTRRSLLSYKNTVVHAWLFNTWYNQMDLFLNLISNETKIAFDDDFNLPSSFLITNNSQHLFFVLVNYVCFFL